MVNLSAGQGTKVRASLFWSRMPPVSRSSASTEIEFDLRAASGALWIVAVIVVTLGVLREIALPFIGTGTMLQDLRHVAFDAEHSLPAWYESILMFCTAGLLALCAKIARDQEPETKFHWALLAVIFALMSIDEAIAVHEVTMEPLRHAFGFSGVLYFS